MHNWGCRLGATVGDADGATEAAVGAGALDRLEDDSLLEPLRAVLRERQPLHVVADGARPQGRVAKFRAARHRIRWLVQPDVARRLADVTVLVPLDRRDARLPLVVRL